MAFVDTMGTLIGVSARAGFLDKDGNLPQIERPMMADALATTFAAVIGTTTSGAYIESATGVEAGGQNRIDCGDHSVMLCREHCFLRRSSPPFPPGLWPGAHLCWVADADADHPHSLRRSHANWFRLSA